MITFIIFFTVVTILVLKVVFKIANEPIKENQRKVESLRNKENYDRLYHEVISKIKRVSNYIEKNKYSYHLEKIHCFYLIQSRVYKYYPSIEELKIISNDFETKFPEVFIVENRDRKLDILLNK